jgi:hypothetical protein
MWCLRTPSNCIRCAHSCYRSRMHMTGHSNSHLHKLPRGNRRRPIRLKKDKTSKEKNLSSPTPISHQSPPAIWPRPPLLWRPVFPLGIQRRRRTKPRAQPGHLQTTPVLRATLVIDTFPRAHIHIIRKKPRVKALPRAAPALATFSAIGSQAQIGHHLPGEQLLSHFQLITFLTAGAGAVT